MLDEYAMYLEIQGKSKNTIKTYLWAVENFLKYIKKDVNEIDQRDILRFLAFLKKSWNYDNNSIRLVVRALSNFFKYLGREDLIKNLKPPKVDKRLPKFITYEELNKLIEAADNLRDKLIIKFLFYTGVRVSELVNLKVSDILWDEGFVRVRKGKGGKERLVPIPSFLLKELKEYLEKRNKDSEYLFISKKGDKLSTRQVQRIIKKVKERAKITKKVTPHVLRHSIATHLLRKGIDIRVIQEFLGHASLSTTQVYTHVLPSHLKEVYKKVFEESS